MKTIPTTLLPLLLAALLSLPANIAPAGATDMAVGKTVSLEQAATVPPEDDWEFTLAPYGWIAGMDGTAGVGGFTSNVDVAFEDILDVLDVGAMLTFGARKGRLGFMSDIIYMKLSTAATTPRRLFSSANVEIEQFSASLLGRYRLIDSERGFLEALAGARFISIENTTTFTPGLLAGRTLGGSREWWDGVGGFRARYQLSDRFFLTAYADAGGGSSDFTWQAFGGLGYALCDTASAIIGYRHLDYDYQDGGFVYDVETSGIMLGVAFAW